MLRQFESNGIAILQFNGKDPCNWVTRDVERELVNALTRNQADEQVQAIVVYGGEGRAFSHGSDFDELVGMESSDDVDRWIDRLIEFYAELLRFEKPTVAALSGPAIGMGAQLAMLFDARVMAHHAVIRMAELHYGIGCALGAAILSTVLPWNAMREIVYDCEDLSAASALKHGMVNEVTDGSKLLSRAVERAKLLSAYPQTAFRSTKRVVNKILIERLLASAADSRQAHRAGFTSPDNRAYLGRIHSDGHLRPMQNLADYLWSV